jgi:site-specific DNA recombinase
MAKTPPRETVAAYMRVSTDRQRTNAASLPSQRDAISGHCVSVDWEIVDEYVEAETATDDRRPQLQKMIDRACAPDKPYDKLVAYSFIDSSEARWIWS